MWEERCRVLTRGKAQKGPLVVYGLQASVRIQDNWTLQAALEQARQESLELVVIFGLDPSFPGANLRSFDFLWKGLVEMGQDLKDLGVGFSVFHGSLIQGLEALKAHTAYLYLDKGYLPYHRSVATAVSDWPSVVVQVEDNALIPVASVSLKAEYSAGTLRRKYLPLMGFYYPPDWKLEGMTKKPSYDLDATLTRAGLRVLAPGSEFPLNSEIDVSVRPVSLVPGEKAGKKQWRQFLDQGLENYHSNSNNPVADGQSHLSAYLHFGQISPVTLARDLKNRKGEGVEAFSEQLFVRRELSLNFVTYRPDFRNFDVLPQWVHKTLAAHSSDKREYEYTLAQWEAGKTHDEAWNAAQKQMVETGKMHGYMRMYWGKKILEWSASPRQAWEIAMVLNDKYSLDGRDPNGYVGVGWCFGLHDRPWGERSVYGMVRCMVYSGLQRKFDVKAYIASNS